MNLFKVSKRKLPIGEIAHLFLNVLLAVSVFSLVYVGDSAVYAALGLVLISKWRIFAVRPRYWWANVLANIVDVTVSLSIVALLYLAGTADSYSLGLQLGITAFYILWLVLIKPRSKRFWVVLQASLALFLGTWALTAFSHETYLLVCVLSFYTIGVGVARHVLALFEESEMSLMSMVFGLILAEIGWLTYHWSVAYSVNFLGDFKLPQMAIISLALGLCIYSLFSAARSGKSSKLFAGEVVAPVLFSVAIIAVLVIFFSSNGPGII